ncbi:MAG: bifunctional oligoribonuclease/PAP phosphatase NrnA [Chloroflexota bacterium]
MRVADVAESGLQDAIGFLQRVQRVVVVAHVNPDADAIGAVLGLSGGLASLGKEVFPALSDTVPDYARFLEATDGIRPSLPSQEVDAFICVDAADIERVGSIYTNNRERFAQTPVLNIDHHRTNPHYGAVNYVDGGASSTSELCYRILQGMNAPIDSMTATALLFGIVGDTGSFRNGATTPGALETAGALLRLGADNQRVAFQLFECKRFVAARLWGRVLSTIELDRRRRIVFAYLSQKELREEGASIDETEGIAEYLRGIEDADVVMLMKETQDGFVRVSMRSQPNLDVSLIATMLDGGGHRQAAGCTLPGPFAAARDMLVGTYDRLNPR